MGAEVTAPSATSRPGSGGSAWLVVAAAFTSMFTVFGVVYSFGAFFNPMAREFGVSSASESAVFAITGFLYFGLGSVTGALADRTGPRLVLVTGALVMSAGLLVTSLAPAIWVAYLGYGLGAGLGTACGYVPMVAAVGARFTQGRAFAIGAAVTGIGLGTLIVPTVSAALIAAIGWRATYRVLAAATLCVLLAAAVIAGPRVRQAASAGDLRLGSAIRTWQFGAMYLSGLLLSFGLFMAFVHLAPFASRRGSDPVAAAALIGVIGVGSTAGRVAMGGLAERVGAIRAYQLAASIMGLSFGVWLAFPAYPGLVVFALALGVGYGGWVALSPSVVAELFGTQGMGGTVGFLYTSAGVGALAGPPLAGLVLDRSGSYEAAVVVALVLGMLGLLPVLPLRPRCTFDLNPSQTNARRH